MTVSTSRVAQWPTASLALAAISSIALAVLPAQGCRTAPVSGRKQLVLIPEAQEIQLGTQAYEETLSSEPISEDAEIVAMVERVGRRIAAVASKPEYDWEFRVIAKDVQNAFALPGGKVAVYEGILPVCQSEAGLAVVMSHEIAHALARHGGERMSQQSVVSGAGTVINAVTQRHSDEATTEKVMQVYGATSQYGVILPFSRKHESEADAIGLILMAKAGYDPSVAPEFWERFSAASGDKPPEWLSTHPADTRRAADLRALLPEAMKYYEAAKEQIGMGEPIPVSHLASTYAMPTDQQVHLASAQNLGSASALTSPHSVKKGDVDFALHTEWAGQEDLMIERAANEQPGRSGLNDFQLPTTTELPPAETTFDASGWEPARGN